MAVPKRVFFPLAATLGEDPQNAPMGAGLSPGVTGVYVLDDLTFSLPQRSTIRVQSAVIPSTGVGNFSGFAIVVNFGCYVRRFLCGGAGNGLVAFNMNGVSALVVTDVQPVLAVQVPDQVHAGVVTATDNAQFYDVRTVAVPVRIPLFRQFDQGQAAAAAFGNASVFLPAGREYVVAGDGLYLPPGGSIFATDNIANTATSWFIDLEFTADATPLP